MKAVILAGGYGTRISEETDVIPKPMVQIGNKPILWHIMKLYSSYGVNEFIICCGYKGYLIKEYFANYYLHMSDVTFDMTKNKMHVHQERAEPWTVTLVDTGESTMTGGRVKRIKDYVENEKAFCLTYGDGISNVNISDLIDFHFKQGTLATCTTTFPPSRFGALEVIDKKVKSFKEKPRGEGGKINGGFFVLSPKVIDLIEDDSTIWESSPMEKLALQGQMSAFNHDDFWQPMDTKHDKKTLEDLWSSGQAPWKNW
jgi:glucose-1-phosphate cytidylyltransferase